MENYCGPWAQAVRQLKSRITYTGPTHRARKFQTKPDTFVMKIATPWRDRASETRPAITLGEKQASITFTAPVLIILYPTSPLDLQPGRSLFRLITLGIRETNRSFLRLLVLGKRNFGKGSNYSFLWIITLKQRFDTLFCQGAFVLFLLVKTFSFLFEDNQNRIIIII